MKKELLLLLAAAALGTVCFSSITADKVSAKTSGDYKYVVTGKKKKTCAIRKYQFPSESSYDQEACILPLRFEKIQSAGKIEDDR